MLGKTGILIVITILLIIFYVVISLGAGSLFKRNKNYKVASYLFGVRILIGLVALVSLILWSFM